MQIEVDTIILHAGSTVAFGLGRDIATGNRIAFAGDYRPMRTLNEALCSDNRLPQAEVEPWQILPPSPASSLERQRL